jgi:hypothetical protein
MDWTNHFYIRKQLEGKHHSNISPFHFLKSVRPTVTASDYHIGSSNPNLFYPTHPKTDSYNVFKTCFPAYFVSIAGLRWNERPFF